MFSDLKEEEKMIGLFFGGEGRGGEVVEVASVKFKSHSGKREKGKALHIR